MQESGTSEHTSDFASGSITVRFIERLYRQIGFGCTCVFIHCRETRRMRTRCSPSYGDEQHRGHYRRRTHSIVSPTSLLPSFSMIFLLFFGLTSWKTTIKQKDGIGSFGPFGMESDAIDRIHLFHKPDTPRRVEDESRIR